MRAAAVRRLLAALLLGALLAGCAELPTAGPVRHDRTRVSGESLEASYFNPPGPAEDGSPAAIVSGFLTALQANPLSTKVAREFLSDRVRSSWQPNRGTIVYDAFSVLPSAGGVRIRLTDVRRLDDRGGWVGGRPGESDVLDVSLVSEGGQWRIDNPPPALIVPTSFFERAFERLSLYFPDQAGRVLLPEPVFVPRGEQATTNLVRGLLSGPGPDLAEVARTAFPRGTDLELSVVVTERGVAEVPLTRELLRAPAAALRRAADQLASTLRQVPGVQRVRMSVGGTPVPLPGGVVDVPVGRGAALDAAGPPDADLVVLRQDRLDSIADGTSAGSDALGPAPLGRDGQPARSLAVGGDPSRVAGVVDDGTGLVEGPLTSGDDGASQEVLSGAGDLGRPSYDVYGGLWVLDRTAAGARVLLVERGEVRVLDVPGVSGRAVAAMTVAHDGSRLAVAFAGSAAVAVVDVLRGQDGLVTGAGTVRSLDLPQTGAAPVDVGWRDPTTLAVLTRPEAGSSRVDLLSVDGSPLGREVLDSVVLREPAQALVVSPSEGTALGLLTDEGGLSTLDGDGLWRRAASRVTAAAYGG